MIGLTLAGLCWELQPCARGLLSKEVEIYSSRIKAQQADPLEAASRFNLGGKKRFRKAAEVFSGLEIRYIFL